MEPNNSVSNPESTSVSTPPVQPPSVNAKLIGPIELVSSSWKLFRAHWKLLISIVILPSAITTVAQLLFNTGYPAFVILGLILIVVAILLGIVMQPAAISAIHRLSVETGAQLTVKGQYKIGFTYFWSIVLLIILQVFIMIGSFALLIIPGIIVSTYVGMYILARVLDDKRGFAAFSESFSLVKGRWWKVIGRLLFMGLVFAVFALVVSGLGYILNLISGFGPKSEGAIAVSLLASLVSNAILGPLALVYIYKLYVSLKSTRLSGVSTAMFKKWLVAFLVIGIVALVAALAILPAIVLTSLGSAREKAAEAYANAMAQQAEVERLVQESIGTTSPVQGNGSGTGN